MTDSRQMFRTLMQAFVEHIPRSAWGDIRRLVVLAGGGAVSEQKSQLARLERSRGESDQ
jgi:hypothetical protein